MRVKSNSQQTVVQVVILAICPLLMVIDNLNQALFYILATCICFAVSAVVCKMFNKLFSKNMKVFVTAILSTFILTIVNYMLGKHTILGIETPTASYYAVLSTICLCLDAYFLDKKSERKLYFFKVIYDCVYFAVILMIFFGQKLRVLLDRFKGFLADDVFHTAGILSCGLFADADRNQKIRKRGMTLVYGLRNGKPGLRKRDMPQFIHFDITVFAEILHGDADAGFCIFKLACDIDGSHRAVSLLQDQDGFQIIFCRFQNFHDIDSFLKYIDR